MKEQLEPSNKKAIGREEGEWEEGSQTIFFYFYIEVTQIFGSVHLPLR